MKGYAPFPLVIYSCNVILNGFYFQQIDISDSIVRV
jgi:hypothetical protein